MAEVEVPEGACREPTEIERVAMQVAILEDNLLTTQLVLRDLRLELEAKKVIQALAALGP